MIESKDAAEIRERDGRALQYVEYAERPGLFELMVTALLRFGVILLLTAVVVKVATL